MIAIVIPSILAAAGYSLMYLLGGGGLGVAILIFIVAKMFGKREGVGYVKLTRIVPFLLEDELKIAGGNYSKGPDWGVYVQSDGMLITGQNPASSAEAAKALLELLQKKS